MKNLTGSAVTVLEQLKNTTGIDLPGLLQNAAAKKKTIGSELPKELG